MSQQLSIDANKVIDNLTTQVGIQTSNYAKQVALLQAQVQQLQQENTELKKKLEEHLENKDAKK
ncbi:hypothetical protein J2S00_003082 [Caldalkalibacillus uzonensis]|uniref:Uncharacterized protein n=1 Tax=Caldalkalibacillus uzonensis TaxID=353224 RepID=A0ABU0CXK8_9BACI|nr:hypothetical protein [Caldalkalibacillus uzonensis]MDQ0340277.1 hypothetical protein [Caldalkalibacillus uzonensis]